MKKLFVGIVFTFLVLVFFCFIFSDDLDNLITGISSKPLEVATLAGEIGTSLSNGGRTSSDYISPAKVEINNAFRGANPEFIFKVRNGSSSPKRYFISIRVPDSLEEGYSFIPLEWVSLDEGEVLVPEGEFREVRVSIIIPKKLPSKKLMFWISVSDGKLMGMVGVQLCSKVMVNIR